MLQLNPNEVIRLNKLMNNSLEIIDENILYLRKKYENTSTIEKIGIEDLEKQIHKIKNNTLFLKDIINELMEATGESIDKILSSNHSLNFFENKLMTYYADKINNNTNKSKLDIIDLCYSKDDKLVNFCQKRNFIEYADNYFQSFKPDKYGLDKEMVINDLLEIYDKRGSNEAYNIMHALENNAPDNYLDFHFYPNTPIHNNNYYDFNNKTIDNYQTNSEIINVNGYNYEITQVLPKDCNKTEMLAYNFGKANIINTMRTLPNKYLEICSKGSNNTITLTCDRLAMNNTTNWSGYYKPSSFFGRNSNNITIDIHGSFNDNVFYTQDTLIHEMGHKFDDLSHEKSIIDWIFGVTSYTKSNDEWTNAYNKYRNIINGINRGGYTDYPNVNEFFGDVTVAYFKSPEETKALCPEVYELMNKMLDGEYGYSYNDRIVAILSANN